MRTRAMTALAFLIAFVPSVLFAGWAGPETVVSGTWGKADDQFTLESEDMGDVFPTEFFVLADGSILIQDGKLKVYRNGRFFKALDLEGDALFCDDAIVVWQRARKTKTSPTPDLTYLTAEGRLIKKIPHTALAGRVLWIRRDCSIVTQDDDRVFRDYDREGRLQGTYFELSSIKHEILPGGGHRTLVSLGADNIVLAGEHYGSFVHDDKGSI